MSDRPRIEPVQVVEAVDRYIDGELRDAAKFDNRQPLDDSGVWSLHALAAEVYAMGWEAAERAIERREWASRQRAKGAD